MFGITPQPTRTTSTGGRIAQNKLEEIRRSGTSSTFDAGGAERMKMEYLKQERERREKERNKMMYEGKKRELDRMIGEEDRLRVEEKRLEQELIKYNHDVDNIKQEEKVELSHVPVLKKEELQLAHTIQKLESELQQAKTRHIKVQQDILRFEQNDKSTVADVHKREAFTASIASKLEDTKRRHESLKKTLAALQAEVTDLKRHI